jgi:hypothetical protein
LFGIIIDSSDDPENANDSIRVKCEFDSNVIDESNLQHEKHSNPIISTLFGIIIDSTDEDEIANDSIRVKCEFDSNVIDESNLQHENILKQEFEHFWESQLIEVMKMQMHLIRFVSIGNLIQMKLMKVI